MDDYNKSKAHSIVTDANWKNVNNWHWIEKDCTEWAHAYLKESLSKVSIDGLSVAKVTSIEGDVSVNVRKGRVRQVYDLQINLELAESETEHATTRCIRITDYMSDTSRKDFEVAIPSCIEKTQQSLLVEALWDALLDFRKVLEQEQGQPLIIDTGLSNQSVTGTTTSTSISRDEPESIATPADAAQNSTVNSSVDFANVPAAMLFQALTDASMIRAWSHNSATFESSKGSLINQNCTLLGGNIQYKITSMTPNQSIDMSWKLKDWSDFASIHLKFKESSSLTTIDITMRNVPKTTSDNSLISNWQRYYWQPIKCLFGVVSSSLSIS